MLGVCILCILVIVSFMVSGSAVHCQEILICHVLNGILLTHLFRTCCCEVRLEWLLPCCSHNQNYWSIHLMTRTWSSTSAKLSVFVVLLQYGRAFIYTDVVWLLLVVLAVHLVYVISVTASQFMLLMLIVSIKVLSVK